jgi:hypothetical protein
MARRSQTARWSEMAHNARVAAGKMRDPVSKEIMLEIAANYERLAERAEREASKPTEDQRRL